MYIWAVKTGFMCICTAKTGFVYTCTGDNRICTGFLLINKLKIEN